MLASLSLFTHIAHANDTERPSHFSTSSSTWDGLQDLVRLAERKLGADRVQVRGILDYEQLSPEDGLLIIYPEKPLHAESLGRFLTTGGRLALLDDFGKSSEFLERFGIYRIRPPLDPIHRLQDDPDLAIAVPVTQLIAGVEQGRHPLTDGVEQVMTNHPVAFRHPELTPVLEIQDRAEQAAPFALSGVISGQGRLIVVGDSSVFIQLMLRYPGNRLFAERIVEYLLSRDEPGPEGKLWIVTGGFQQRGQYGEPPLSESLQERLEQLQEKWRQIEDEGLPPPVFLALSLLLAFALFRQEGWLSAAPLPRPRPSYTRAPLVAAQSGLLARAEVLSAPTTPLLLTLLELRAALEESLLSNWSLAPPLDLKEVAQAAERAGVPEAQRAALTGTLEELRARSQDFERGRAPRTSETDLKRLHQQMMALLPVIRPPTRRPFS